MKTIYRRKESIIPRRIAGEMLLVPIRGNLADMRCLHVLEGAGDFIWEQLDGTRTLDAIRDEMVRHFDVAAGEAERDLREFVGELEAKGLVEDGGADAGM